MFSISFQVLFPDSPKENFSIILLTYLVICGHKVVLHDKLPPMCGLICGYYVSSFFDVTT